MDPQDIITYLQTRRQSRINRQNASPEGKAYSIDDPHNCRHCNGVCLELVRVYETFTCLSCLGECSLDPADKALFHCCPKCGRQTRAIEHTNIQYTANLGHCLALAHQAALDGCIFYRTILDRTCKNLNIVLPDWERAEVLVAGIPQLEFEIFGVTWPSDPNAISNFFLRLRLGEKEDTFELDLQGWSTVKDGVSEFIQARPYERDVNSITSQRFARSCLQTCMNEHPECRQGEASLSDTDPLLSPERTDVGSLPSRLVDIDPNPGAQAIRIIHVGDIDLEAKTNLSSKGYMALSYCWGGDQPVKLTKSSFSDLTSGIPISNLPQTLRDAVCVGRILDLRFIWIDCLCIIQDDMDDKAQEISRMSKFYSNATLTLSAASASTCHSGFLERRQYSPFSIGPMKIPVSTRDGNDMGYIYLLQEALSPGVHIATRAWTLQESLLSRRLLIYSQRQLYWTCSTAFAECGGSKRSMIKRMNFGYPSLVEEIYPLSVFQNHPSYSMWDSIVTQYMTRQLGFGDDKLPAISAVVSKLIDMWAARGVQLDYKAGFLLDPDERLSWYVQLLWRSTTSEASRTTDFRAPSWSWASIDGRVEPYFSLRENAYQVEAAVESCCVKLLRAQAPYGQIRCAKLTLKARVWTMSDIQMSEAVGSILWDPRLEQNVKPLWSLYRVHSQEPNELIPKVRLLLCPDSRQDKAAISTAMESQDSSEQILLVPIARGISELSDPDGVHGLLLTQSANCMETYARLGTFSIDNNESWDIFKEATQSVLCIV